MLSCEGHTETAARFRGGGRTRYGRFGASFERPFSAFLIEAVHRNHVTGLDGLVCLRVDRSCRNVDVDLDGTVKLACSLPLLISHFDRCKTSCNEGANRVFSVLILGDLYAHKSTWKSRTGIIILVAVVYDRRCHLSAQRRTVGCAHHSSLGNAESRLRPSIILGIGPNNYIFGRCASACCHLFGLCFHAAGCILHVRKRRRKRVVWAVNDETLTGGNVARCRNSENNRCRVLC